MPMSRLAILLGLLCLTFPTSSSWAQVAPSAAHPEKIIIDTDVGDDIDDAFALALAMRSPELEIMGVTTGFGDTETRAKLVDRLLGEAGRQDIPVAAGVPTQNKNPLSQRRYAEGGHFAKSSHPAEIGRASCRERV